MVQVSLSSSLWLGVCVVQARTPICLHQLTKENTLTGPSPGASEQESVVVPVLAGYVIPTNPK